MPGSGRLAETRRALEEFQARSAREEASRARTLAELSTLARPFDRHAGPVHVTGSALIWGPRGTVLLFHKKLHIWVQPGGHIDPGETAYDAALREASEETGLPVRHPVKGPQLLHIDVHPAADDHVHLDLTYLLLCDEDVEPAPAAGESTQVRWLSLEEAFALADEGLVDGLQRLGETGATWRS